MSFDSQAGQYAEKFGFKTLVDQGRGAEYNRGILETAFRRIAGGTVENMQNVESSAINKGFQFSGVSEVKGPNAVIANSASQAMSSINQLVEDDSRFKLDMASKWIDILKHEENYDMQMRQLQLQEDAAQEDLLSVMGKVGAIASAFTPFL